MILVTTGTHDGQFDRLIKRIDEIAPKIKEKIVVQIGYGKYKPRNIEYFDFAPSLDKYYKSARLIIVQAATSLIEISMKYKKPVITVPRQARYHEHINDHQVEFAQFFSERTGIKCILDVKDLTPQLLEKYNRKANIKKDNLFILQDYYSSFFKKMAPLGKNRIDYVVNLISPKKDDKVLNIGISNIPEVEMAIEGIVKECWTVDIDKEKLSKAGKFLNRTKLLNENIIKSKSIKKEYFDKVVMLEVLEHIKEEESVLQWVHSILKPNGKLILSVPNNNFMHYLHPVTYLQHERQYTEQRIRSVLRKAGFSIESFNIVETWTLLLNLYIHFIFKYILRKQKKFLTFSESANNSYKQINRKGLNYIILSRKS